MCKPSVFSALFASRCLTLPLIVFDAYMMYKPPRASIISPQNWKSKDTGATVEKGMGFLEPGTEVDMWGDVQKQRYLNELRIGWYSEQKQGWLVTNQPFFARLEEEERFLESFVGEF